MRSWCRNCHHPRSAGQRNTVRRRPRQSRGTAYGPDQPNRGHQWIVTGGLAPGEKVITQGTANLKDGAEIRPVRLRAAARRRTATGGKERRRAEPLAHVQDLHRPPGVRLGDRHPDHVGGHRRHRPAARRAISGYRAARSTSARSYPGASAAETLESSVTQIIEQQLTGIDGLIYFSSTSNARGSVADHRDVREGHRRRTSRRCRCRTRCSRRCRGCRRPCSSRGCVVTKANPDFLLVISPSRRDGPGSRAATCPTTSCPTCRTRSAACLASATCRVFGSQYAMRIWLDPSKLASYQSDAARHHQRDQAQNTQVAAGQIGGAAGAEGQMLNATVTARSRLTTPEQFRHIIVKTAAGRLEVRSGRRGARRARQRELPATSRA